MAAGRSPRGILVCQYYGTYVTICQYYNSTVIGHRWLALLRDLHSNLTDVAVIFCQSESVAPARGWAGREDFRGDDGRRTLYAPWGELIPGLSIAEAERGVGLIVEDVEHADHRTTASSPSVISDRQFAVQLNHFVTDFLSDSVAFFL